MLSVKQRVFKISKKRTNKKKTDNEVYDEEKLKKKVNI